MVGESKQSLVETAEAVIQLDRPTALYASGQIVEAHSFAKSPATGLLEQDRKLSQVACQGESFRGRAVHRHSGSQVLCTGAGGLCTGFGVLCTEFAVACTGAGVTGCSVALLEAAKNVGWRQQTTEDLGRQHQSPVPEAASQLLLEDSVHKDQWLGGAEAQGLGCQLQMASGTGVQGQV